MHYPLDLSEETLKIKVKYDYFDLFDHEAIDRIDFALLPKGSKESHKDLCHYLLWAEAKRGRDEDIYDSLVQLILTIGVNKLHKNYSIPQFLGAFDCEKIAFIPYEKLKDFIDRNDFDYTSITPSDHKSESFARMHSLTIEILKSKSIIFDFKKDNAELKDFIKDSVAKGKANPIKIDDENFDLVYSRWHRYVFPIINLGKHWQEIRKNLKLLESDFFLADLMSKDDKSLDIDSDFIKNLRIIINKRLEKDKEILFYEAKTEKALFEEYQSIRINITDPNIYHQFWNFYERPPKEQFWREIFNRRDKLTPRDIRERKGAFFTPRIWAKKAKEYLESALGKDYQDEYYIWDCAAGTGNLLVGFDNPRRVFASTLDLSDVLIMQNLVKMDKDTAQKDRLDLLEGHIFQFDFLNDDFSKLPENLQRIIKDEPQKLIIFINPPYAEATSSKSLSKTNKNSHKPQVATETKIYKDTLQIIGKAGRDIFAQFFIRIYKEIPNCTLASFSTLKYINSSNFIKFRDTFKARFLKGFIVPADTFDNVKGEFPIGFLIWDLSNKENFKEIKLDIFNEKNENLGQKTFYKPSDIYNIKDWLRYWNDSLKLEKSQKLAHLVRGSADFQNNQVVFITLNPSQSVINASNENSIFQENLIINCIFFAVRHAIKHTWINHNDQFLYPNDKWQEDSEFQNDCLAFALFYEKNRLTCKEGINHFIPFTESELGAKEAFRSDFMFRFINGKIKIEARDKQDNHLFKDDKTMQIQSFIPTKPLDFSPESVAVFKAGRELFKYYHKQARENRDYQNNAALYDIKEFFQGRAPSGRMNPPQKAQDSHYKILLASLNLALNALAKKLESKIYECGFLK